MKECCIVPTFHREELLFYCLSLIRAFEPEIDLHVFPDRGTFYDPLVQQIADGARATLHLVPDNEWYGNTANAMNAYLWAFNAGYDRVFYIESDILVHPDFFTWHRAQHEEREDIFASMAWVFNRFAPLTDDVMYQPWFYAIGVCFARPKLELVVRHATPLYYADMPGYLAKHFRTSPLNDPLNISHYEQDGLIQRILDEDKSQTVSPGIAKCSHLGFSRSYGSEKSLSDYDDFLGKGRSFEERLAKLQEFVADPYWRATIFDREVVEREIGHRLSKREITYRVTLPGGWETTFVSELGRAQLPRRIHSVTLPPEAVIEKISDALAKVG
jgi:hypothetical protein